jgi:hypothetical protein
MVIAITRSLVKGINHAFFSIGYLGCLIFFYQVYLLINPQAFDQTDHNPVYQSNDVSVLTSLKMNIKISYLSPRKSTWKHTGWSLSLNIQVPPFQNKKYQKKKVIGRSISLDDKVIKSINSIFDVKYHHPTKITPPLSIKFIE